MDRSLKKLFDYQRFARDPHLEKLIEDTERRYAGAGIVPLEDEALTRVAAAGSPEAELARRKNGRKP